MPVLAFLARSPLRMAFVVILLSAGLTALDFSGDSEARRAADLGIDFLDRLLLLGAVWFIAVLVGQVGRIERESLDARREISRVSDAAEHWRGQSRRLLEGLGEAIAQQFRDWQLTPAEAEIAGLMLKGLPLKDIAVLRRTSEATIRQQAQAIYRKSGLANRAELSAYFLEDMFDAATAAIGEPSLRASDGKIN